MWSARTAAPARNAVTLADARRQCRVDVNDHDADLLRLIETAIAQVENDTRRGLITQTWQARFDAFADALELPRGPLQAVDSVEYLDADGAEQTLAADQYRHESWRVPGRVTPAHGVIWPCTQAVGGAVTVTYQVGFGDAPESVPAPLRAAALLLVAHWFENREVSTAAPGGLNEIPRGYEALTAPYRILYL